MKRLLNKVVMAVAVVALPVLARAEGTTVEALTTQVSGIGTTAQTVFLSIAGIAVGAFVIRTVIQFAKKGSV